MHSYQQSVKELIHKITNLSTKAESYQSLNTDSVDLTILQFIKNQGVPLTAKNVVKLTVFPMCTVSGAISRLRDNKLLVVVDSYRAPEPGSKRENVYAPADDVDDKVLKIQKKKASKKQKALVAKAKAAKGNVKKIAKLIQGRFPTFTAASLKSELKLAVKDIKSTIKFLLENQQVEQTDTSVYSFKIHQ